MESPALHLSACRGATQICECEPEPFRYSTADEDVVAGKAGFRWVAGAFDGAMSPGGEGDEAEAITAQILLALRSLADRATDEHAARLYSPVAQHRTLLFVDALLERVVNEKTLRTDRVQAIARWLATDSPDREAVKTAIAILGVVLAEKCGDGPRQP